VWVLLFSADHGWQQSLSTRGGGGYDGSEFQGTSSKVSFWPLFKHHLRDWVIIVIMAILEIIDYVLIPPYHRFVSEHNINSFTFPSNKYTVPTWSVLVRIIISSLNFLFNLAQSLQHVDKILLSIEKRISASGAH
jgi:hypothetical protein